MSLLHTVLYSNAAFLYFFQSSIHSLSVSLSVSLIPWPIRLGPEMCKMDRLFMLVRVCIVLFCAAPGGESVEI